MSFFDDFRATLGGLEALHDGIIGRDARFDTPFGRQRLIYADYVASGRALRQVEQAVMDHILPWYANSHTEASHCGGIMTRLRRAARAEILRCTSGSGDGGGGDHAVVFTGSGATAGLNRLVHLLQAGPGMRVLIGPYEHHSNILPWRESGADVTELPEDAAGGPDRAALRAALAEPGRKIVALSAASNVNGTISDVAGLTRMVKEAGAAMVWDYAGAGPYLPIDMRLGMDAVVVSPHKFLGGPGASGVMILRRDAVRVLRPTLPGGGTVRFVNDRGHDYALAIEAREESGTPNVIGDLRAAMVFAIKDHIGQAAIDAIHARWLEKAAQLRDAPGLRWLFRPDLPRLPILAFQVIGAGGPVHQQLATRILSDRYGVQARGGCACAGPYVHRLLGIGPTESESLRQAILAGAEMDKPGFVRLNLCWAAPETEIDAILSAVRALPRACADHAAQYRGDPSRAIFAPAIAAE